jgi:acylglycerol lipase
MLLGGRALLHSGYARFPSRLPVLLLHGSADRVRCSLLGLFSPLLSARSANHWGEKKVTSFDATKEFFEKIDAKDKTFKPYEGYYHELHFEVLTLPVRPKLWS